MIPAVLVRPAARARLGACVLGCLALCLPMAKASPISGVKIEVRRSGEGAAVVAYNPSRVPVWARVDLSLSRNVRSDRGMIFETLVRPLGETVLTRLRADGLGEASVRLSHRLSVGDPNAVLDPGARMRLPFPDGHSYRVTQSPNGPITTHSSLDAREAIDFAMPIGTPVLAVRAGWVIDQVRNFGEGAPEPGLMMRANYVQILHDDGTWTLYAHLSDDGPVMVRGQRVEAGDIIGRSGNSGYSSGPHLHFALQRNSRTFYESLPVRFWTRSRGPLIPVTGENMRAD